MCNRQSKCITLDLGVIFEQPSISNLPIFPSPVKHNYVGCLPGEQLGMRLLIREELANEFVHYVLWLKEVEEKVGKQSRDGIGFESGGFAEMIEKHSGLLHGGDQRLGIRTLHVHHRRV